MLPKLDVPIYEMQLISTGKTIRYRPFTVKEEKLFLMANESDDLDSVINTIKQVVTNCVLDDIDIELLPIFDIENIFLNLRAKSISEVVNLKYRCNNNVKDEEGKEKKCGHIINLNFNALEIEPEKNEKHNKTIQLTDKLGIVMKYPNFNIVEKTKNLPEAEMVAKMITLCVDYIFDENEVYYSKDVDEQELVDFIDSLTREQFLKIQEFFDTIPKLKKELDFKCTKCAYEEKVILEGIQSFFV